MTALIDPDTSVRSSFLIAMDEFRAEGRGGADDDSMLGSEVRDWSTSWHEPDGFGAYVSALRAAALEQTPRPAGHVPSTTKWWADGSEYLGRITVRHRLTQRLFDIGGHIGYDVRPSARRRGNATAMLHAILPLCREFGIEQALVTCDVDNVGSRKVIEAAGGVFDDERTAKLRFWVPTDLQAS